MYKEVSGEMNVDKDPVNLTKDLDDTIKFIKRKYS
jgi:hypothetical protein